MPKPVSEQVHGSCPGRVLRHSVFTRLIGRRPRRGEIATATVTRLRQARSKAQPATSEPAPAVHPVS